MKSELTISMFIPMFIVFVLATMILKRQREEHRADYHTLSGVSIVEDALEFKIVRGKTESAKALQQHLDIHDSDTYRDKLNTVIHHNNVNLVFFALDKAGQTMGVICCITTTPCTSIEILAFKSFQEGTGKVMMKAFVDHVRDADDQHGVLISVPHTAHCLMSKRAIACYKHAKFIVSDGSILMEIGKPKRSRGEPEFYTPVESRTHSGNAMPDQGCDGKCTENNVICRKCCPVLYAQYEHLQIVDADGRGNAVQAKQKLREGTVIAIYGHVPLACRPIPRKKKNGKENGYLLKQIIDSEHKPIADWFGILIGTNHNGDLVVEKNPVAACFNPASNVTTGQMVPVGAAINHNDCPNAKIVDMYGEDDRPVMVVQLTKDVEEGEEITIDYGDEYNTDEFSNETVFNEPALDHLTEVYPGFDMSLSHKKGPVSKLPKIGDLTPTPESEPPEGINNMHLLLEHKDPVDPTQSPDVPSNFIGPTQDD
jgi:hypothetical protein